jgi:transposase-like protein
MDAINTVEQKRKPRRAIGARAKAEAVLSVWSGRRKAAQVCRELGVNWGTLSGWERKGLQGMHKALGGEEPRAPAQMELGRRLEGQLTKLAPGKVDPPAPLAPEKQV